MIPAGEIAARLDLPSPTPEQERVIESALRPVLVVAGAGSGKTETMAARVIWLLANGLAEPGEVLGLTFTRKAAAELSARVQRRIAQLERSGLLPAIDPLELPRITTYNAFANAVFRDHAHRIGRDPDSAVLTEAAAWIMTRKLVLGADDERLIELDKSPDAITGAVLRLNRALVENRVDRDDVLRLAAEFLALAELPRGGRGKTPLAPEVSDSVLVIGALPVLVDLADELERRKREGGLIEFADQVALASEIVERAPAVASDLRDRHRVVLLDEYQDTSVAQTRLLATLFRDHPVMAVGDPHQSIYGWRGASAANLSRFGADFSGDDAPVLGLSVSWRNPKSILHVANSVIAPLGPAGVEALSPRPGAPDGLIDVAVEETADEEAERVAHWFADAFSASGPPPSAALLCRTLKQVHPFLDALHRHGVPYRVLGLGGLLEEPAVADLLCALHVLRRTDANAELLRLLSGARWRIGVRDLDRLGRIAAWLVTRDHAQRPLEGPVLESVRSSVHLDEQRSLVDAVEFVASAPPDHHQLAELSAEARERVRAFAGELAWLRSRAGLDLPALVGTVERAMLLDVEVAARPDDRRARAALDAFEEQVAAFHAADPTADLGAFLTWIAEAERRDALAPRPDEPEEGVVQVLTIHGAKGLEWDRVAVVRMVDGELPSDPRTTRGWLSFGELPYAFRTDRAQLPELAWRSAGTQADFVTSFAGFRDAERMRLAEEERRLAYVAITRARGALLLTGAFWSVQSRHRMPSVFLRDAETAGALPDALPLGPVNEENPTSARAESILWPRDPLGARRPDVERAARLVRDADPGIETPWDELVDALLAERAAAGRRPAPLPERVAASQFKDYVDDPVKVLTQRRRPMPRRPFRQTRVGTEFHAWVESRFAGPVSSLAFDLDADAADELAFDQGDDDELWNDATFLDDLAADERHERLRELQERFGASPWGQRQAEDVELELHLVLDGQIVVCKIDAVFRVGERYEIVDWKTGVAPRGRRDLELRQYQLSLYRLAYARWKDVPIDRIDALFYFVSDDLVIAPPMLLDEDELVRRWRRVRQSSEMPLGDGREP